MKRCLLLLLWYGWSMSLIASVSSNRFPSMEQLLHSLDVAMEEYACYMNIREQRIEDLKKRQQVRTVSSRDFYYGLDSIYTEYKAYNCDSSLLYLRWSFRWATEYGTADDVLSVRLKQIYHMASAGMYREASDILKEVSRKTVSSARLSDYYYSCYKLYDEMGHYTQDEEFCNRYEAQAISYSDSLQRILDATSFLGRERKEHALRLSGRFDEALTINATAPGIIARTCSQIGAYFIHLSTDYVFDGKGDSPWRESDKTSPANAYGLTKLRGEERVLAQAPDSLILRLSWLHAANHSNFITAFCRRLQTQSVVSVVDDQFGSPTAADDVADVIGKILLLKRNGIELSGIYHFANGGFCSRFECAEEILRQLQSAGISWTLDKKLLRAKTTDFSAMDPRPQNCRLDTEKIRHALKITPRAWQQALGATLRQYF